MGSLPGDTWAWAPRQPGQGPGWPCWEWGEECLWFRGRSAGALGKDQRQGGGQAVPHAKPTPQPVPTGGSPAGVSRITSVPGKVQERCESQAAGKANRAEEKDTCAGQVGAGRSGSRAPVTGGSTLPIGTFPPEKEWPGALRGSANPRVSPKRVPEWLSLGHTWELVFDFWR